MTFKIVNNLLSLFLTTSLLTQRRKCIFSDVSLFETQMKFAVTTICNGFVATLRQHLMISSLLNIISSRLWGSWEGFFYILLKYLNSFDLITLFLFSLKIFDKMVHDNLAHTDYWRRKHYARFLVKTYRKPKHITNV